jgi:hypothetical protein
MPRSGLDGLPRDWWQDVEEIFVASAVPLVGKLWLEQNDDTVHVVPISDHEAHAASRGAPFTRLRGSDGAGAHDAFELRFDGTVRGPEIDVDMAPMRATVERLLARFDHLHPEAMDESNYLSWSHRHHLAALLTLPPAPWVLVGIAGLARIVIV